MDKCNTIRDTRGGVETLCRQENAYLLDISGDTIQMIKNAVKAMFGCIDEVTENMCSDVYREFWKGCKSIYTYKEIQCLLNTDINLKNAAQVK